MKSLILSLMDGDPIEEEALATTRISEVTSTEREERRKLVAYCCNNCQNWWKFVRDMNPTPEEEVCPDCGGKPSAKSGFQITTQRTFNPAAKKMTKEQLKRLGA